MKNVTITLEDEISLWAKTWAAKNDTSVFKLLGQLLRERMLEEEGYHAIIPFQRLLIPFLYRYIKLSPSPCDGLIHKADDASFFTLVGLCELSVVAHTIDF